MFRVVIPARYGSSRFPGKPLVSLAGKPMLQWVWERARNSTATEVIVATDDSRIADTARSFGAQVVLTATDHPSGTSRIAAVAARESWADDAIVVNVQGDEPLLPPQLIDQVARLLASRPDADIATLATPLTGRAQFLDPAAVKLVTDARGRALYFSRAPIPWPRDAALDALPPAIARRHLGLYAYRVGALRQLSAPVAAGVSALEELEKLEQLRALTLGLGIIVADAIVAPGPDINTPEDVPAVEALLRR
jgi:3-deoxy-manno-octulosonate cytidylyltransferase (CMP-KDO synthetase)